MAYRITTKSPRGVAMFVVLGAILVCSLLGVLVLQLANRDNLLTGSLVEIKSQRMAAIASLNMTVARMEMNPNQSVSIFNDFHSDSTKQWIDFSGDSLRATNSEPAWYSINAGDSSAIKVRILGLSSMASSSTSIDVLLEGQGRGRNGDPFKVKALYRIRGLGFQNYTKTNGTTNAFMAAGGVDQLHIGNAIDGPMYSGNASGLTTIENNNSSITKIRLAGSLRTTANIDVKGNSIIGGYLDVNSPSSNVVFDSSLIVKGGIKNLQGIVSVGKSFYVYGSPVTINGGASTQLNVGENFYVRDAPLNMTPSNGLIVGTVASPSGLAYFKSGAYFNDNTNVSIYGRMYTGVLPNTYTDGTSLYGTLSVSGNFSYFNSGTGTLRNLVAAKTGNCVISGNANFAGAMTTYPNVGTSKSIAISGKSSLMNGIASIGGDNNAGGIRFGDSVYLLNTTSGGQTNRTGQAVVFAKNLSLNGVLSSDFKKAANDPVYSWNGWWWQQFSTYWTFSNNGFWTYSSQGFAVSNAAIYGASSAIQRAGNQGAPAWVQDATAVEQALPTLVYDPTNTTTSGNLGFSAADTTLSADADVNQASAIDTSQFNADRFGWTNIYNRYNAGGTDAGACKDVGNGYSDLGNAFGKYPTADMLACIYNHEKTKAISESAMWNDGQYLIIHFKGDKYEWGGTNGPGGVLPAGVKILYFFSPSSRSPSSAFGCGGELWYGGAFGSEQVIVSYTNMSGFAWNGTFYGFLYFNYPGTGQQQMLDCSDATLVGSWENASKTSSIWFPIDKATASLSIDYSSIRAKGVFSDIASSFSTSLGSDGKVAIKFSGDRNTTGPLTLSTKATLQDGWVQFERLGEFR